MALAVFKTYIPAEVLFASDLNSSFTTIHNNALALISPLTGNLDVDGFDLLDSDEIEFRNAAADATAAGRLRRNATNLTWHDGTSALNLLVSGGGVLLSVPDGTLEGPSLAFTNDLDTGLTRRELNALDVAGAGRRIIRFTGAAGATNYLEVGAMSAGNAPLLIATGADANVSLRVVPKGTGYLQIATAGGYVAGGDIVPSLAMADGRSGLVHVVSGELSLLTNYRRVLNLTAVAAATNYLQITPAASGGSVSVGATGGDANIGLTFSSLGTGDIQFNPPGGGNVTVSANAAIVPAAVSGTPAQHGFFRDNVPKAWASFSTAPALAGSFNITSLTDNAGAGDVTLTLDRDFASVNYCPVVSNGVTGGSTMHMSVLDWTVGSVRFRITDMANTLVDASGYVAFFGPQ